MTRRSVVRRRAGAGGQFEAPAAIGAGDAAGILDIQIDARVAKGAAAAIAIDTALIDNNRLVFIVCCHWRVFLVLLSLTHLWTDDTERAPTIKGLVTVLTQ